jgi:Spy/CpxP family protein refolding chaperone
MKNFRTFTQLALIAGVLAMCSVPATVRAQEAPQSDPQGSMQGQSPAGRHQHPDELANLNLSDDQKAQVQKIREDAKSQMAAVKNDSALSVDQQQAKMQEIRMSTRKQIHAVLTPEQRKQMKADEMARKAAKQQGSAAPPPQQ